MLEFSSTDVYIYRREQTLSGSMATFQLNVDKLVADLIQTQTRESITDILSVRI